MCDLKNTSNKLRKIIQPGWGEMNYSSNREYVSISWLFFPIKALRFFVQHLLYNVAQAAKKKRVQLF